MRYFNILESSFNMYLANILLFDWIFVSLSFWKTILWKKKILYPFLLGVYTLTIYSTAPTATYFYCGNNKQMVNALE